MYFDTQEDLYEYVSNEDYLSSPDYKGVCMGLDVNITTDHNINMKVYFNDQSYAAGHLTYGVRSEAASLRAFPECALA